jgi:hypothetical protein
LVQPGSILGQPVDLNLEWPVSPLGLLLQPVL